MDRSQHLGELQYAIMRVLWDEGEATVAQVVELLPRQQRRALTTIATMLTKMEKKGVVDHRAEGRQFIYVPKVSESDVHRSMVADLTERLFRGDVGALVNHLISEQEIDPSELARLKTLIADRQRKEKPNAR
ncbi:MAG TPA: BlaI/MecI/CopY family transcriptional regulator [Planctomycetota bacterium]|nr:BlaI/MecI/CopY family transcriptional regulator [Planctomycetota bacterium]